MTNPDASVTVRGEAVAALARGLTDEETCDHSWEEVESMFTNEHFTEVRCTQCRVSGERDKRDGEVIWPAT